MRYIIPCVEQLDRAALELRDNNPVNSRLSLILTDNVVELVCQRKCRDLIQMDGGRSWADNPKFSQRERRGVLGPFFDQKISFLRRAEELTEVEQEFILIAHEYRNKTYHVGLHDDSILWALAWHYHKLACELFCRLRPAWTGSTSADPYTDRVKYHLGNIGKKPGIFLSLALDALSASISAERPPCVEPLGEVLSRALDDEIEELESNLEFLVRDNPAGSGKAAILRNVQYYTDFQGQLYKTELFPSDAAFEAHAMRIKASMAATWQPRFERIPLKSWRDRAAGVAAEKDYLKVLKKFESVRNDKMYLSDAINEAASGLDAHIQMEIDHARGK